MSRLRLTFPSSGPVTASSRLRACSGSAVTCPPRARASASAGSTGGSPSGTDEAVSRVPVGGTASTAAAQARRRTSWSASSRAALPPAPASSVKRSRLRPVSRARLSATGRDTPSRAIR
ncbi:hypothetical protein [Deinococcus radiodurans]|uniref:hypothetical protein n=1 Tax=Deinococcus radiodurans TaxID=1299 RepID=UPI001FB68473|nr:hypothetical protein [Deinococcus radiodurans]